MQSSTHLLTPCLVESVIFSGSLLGENASPSHQQNKIIADMDFDEHEQRWIEMSQEVSFSSALRYLRTRMFIDKNMKVIIDESQVHQLALALYRYRSGDIDETKNDREFMNVISDWNELNQTVMDLSISPVLPEYNRDD